MDDTTRKAFRNIMIFTGVKIAVLYAIRKSIQNSLKQ